MRFIILALSLLLLTSSPSQATAAGSFASTPQDEIVRAFGARVLRTNVAGRYAMVLIAADAQRGMATSRAFLLQRFSFGWQGLFVWPAPGYCILNGRGISPDDQQRLMLGMPKRASNDKCLAPELIDAGPRGDVESVRQMMDGQLVPFVKVSGNYAYGQKMGGGDDADDGCKLFRREANGWRLLVSCHGGLDSQAVCRLGVPQNTLRALSIELSCGAVQPAPAPAQEAITTGSAAAVVTRYYALWNAKNYRAAYELLSSRYRAGHPYSAWLAQHQGTDSITVDAKPGTSPADVQVIIHSVDRDAAGHLSESSYTGTWHLILGGYGWLLDSVSLH